MAILYADIVDYSRLTEQDEDKTHIRVRACLRAIHDLTKLHRGRIAHLAGDAILAEFKDAASALRCAINFQLTIRQRNANFGSREQIRFRIGINYGEVNTDHGDIYGKAVNIAARLEGLASSGGICVSRSLRESLEKQSHFRFFNLGKRHLKNISTPVEVFWICYGGCQHECTAASDIRNSLRTLRRRFLRLSGLFPSLVNPGFFHNKAGE